MAGIIAVFIMCCAVFGGFPLFIAGLVFLLTQNFFITAIVGFVCYAFYLFRS